MVQRRVEEPLSEVQCSLTAPLNFSRDLKPVHRLLFEQAEDKGKRVSLENIAADNRHRKLHSSSATTEYQLLIHRWPLRVKALELLADLERYEAFVAKALPAIKIVMERGSVIYWFAGGGGGEPVPLLEEIIKAAAPSRGMVLDPFAGSGPTLIASERTGRACCAAELEPRYCDIILARWEALSGSKASLIKD